MNKALVIGIILSLCIGIGFVMETNTIVKSSPSQTTQDLNQTQQIVEVKTWIEGLDGMKIYNNELESEKEVKLCSNVEGTWTIGYEQKKPKEGVLNIEDFNQTQTETNSTYALKEGKMIMAKFGSDVYVIRLESIQSAKERMLKEAFMVAYYEAYSRKDKSCGYVLERTKEICEKVGIQVYAMHIGGLNGHVIPVISVDEFAFFGVQPHTLNGFTTEFKKYDRVRILSGWEIKQVEGDGTSEIHRAVLLTNTDIVFIEGFYFKDIPENTELKKHYVGREWELEDIKSPIIRECMGGSL